ncbi:MAG: ribbon-helix-helix protein, CopG family [Actinobacteria bacterium]|nr:ribbon-helix-helix protein, CopG family [Actinomycetota bacterium]
MKSKYIRINITLPEENLKEIDDFCLDEKLTRSEFIREASLDFMSGRAEMKMRNQVCIDRKKAIEIANEFRKSSSMENGGEIIRKFRDERKMRHE